jgi:hypothetical protein
MPQFIRSVFVLARCCAFAVAAAFGGATVAFAAPKKAPLEPPKEPAYALEYAVVIFTILISLAIVYRPGKRTDLVDEVKLPFGPKR